MRSPATITCRAFQCRDTDPIAGGAYSGFGVGDLTRAGSRHVSPEGRVHCAGDHVSSRLGFMHGALESAARVVREIEAT